jgi:hypothetical protein
MGGDCSGFAGLPERRRRGPDHEGQSAGARSRLPEGTDRPHRGPAGHGEGARCARDLEPLRHAVLLAPIRRLSGHGPVRECGHRRGRGSGLTGRCSVCRAMRSMISGSFRIRGCERPWTRRHLPAGLRGSSRGPGRGSTWATMRPGCHPSPTPIRRQERRAPLGSCQAPTVSWPKRPGHGELHFSLTLGAGTNRTVVMTMPSNLASRTNGPLQRASGSTKASSSTTRKPPTGPDWAVIPDGSRVTVDLAGGRHTVRFVQVSAMLRPANPDDANDPGSQNGSPPFASSRPTTPTATPPRRKGPRYVPPSFRCSRGRERQANGPTGTGRQDLAAARRDRGAAAPLRQTRRDRPGSGTARRRRPR